ncbi:dihydroneopterin aldolase [Companilactobacillus heilongjiangensis]|uniref:7,8-dihydroneopterin aldolase n=1 Tax=Companilactobacillus heilongjiangensis TaxID=1074467 RepID=A0A0K2LDJ6_9LACO|nr:dihydroneopterin aldolase [Companilactobacillus heilongjiangensis]ALB29374.1 dienelactone hydrolase [Companilactobacillus heilongjiangensis]
MYCIKINNMKFHSHIGKYAEEKKMGQNLEIDLRVEMNKFVVTDKIEDTISYSQFYEIISEIVSNSRVDLIETLAQKIIFEIKKVDEKKIIDVIVNVRKLSVPIDGIFDNVEVEMRGR